MAGISGRALATRLGVSQPTISRAESGDQLPSVPLAKAWLQAVGADDESSATVLSLVEAGHTETLTYRLQAKAQPHLQGHVADLEARTRNLCAVGPAVLHGLVQVPEYAKIIMRLADTEGMIDQTAALEARLLRQTRLQDDSRTFSFITFEHVLRAPFMPTSQLERLAQLATGRPHITIGIVPASVDWPAIPWNGFSLYRLSDESRVVAIELTHGETTLTRDDDLDLYQRVHDQWRSSALQGAEAAALCEAITKVTA